MCLCTHAYQRVTQSGCPTALGVELGWWYHRSHPLSLTPQSPEPSTLRVPPERVTDREIEKRDHQRERVDKT